MTPEEIALMVQELPTILKLIQEIAKQAPEEIKATVEAFKTIKEAIK
jgi:hypothetical protein